MRTGSPGGRDLAKPRCEYGFNDYISGYTGANATTDYYSTLVGSAFNTYWGALAVIYFPFCGEGQGARLAGGLPLAGVRIKIVYIRYANAALDELPSNDGNYRSIRDAAWEHDRHPQRLAEMTRYSATLSQQAGSGSLSFNGIWVRMSATTAGASYQLGYANRMVSSIIICMPSRARISITAIIRWWASPFAAVRQAGSLTTRFNHDKNYGSQLQSSYTGSAGEKNAFQLRFDRQLRHAAGEPK
ncbi:hypothetical protein LNP20_15570 [Klebsiella pneumoniae subsp. pneumoniae]|nr:hypothetical protein [Klebsiella pneumoniae subsp. pneumoniae]